MSFFDYGASRDAVRPDIPEAHRRTWQHVAAPGTWLTGAQRVAVAEETRRARDCALCRERKAALSPNAVSGEHDQSGRLAPGLVDLVHRVTTDAKRLSKAWHDGLIAAGLPVEEYVEALGVAVLVISIDEFHHALGLPPERLPEPQVGDPSRVRTRGASMQDAWVPMVDPKRTDPATRALLAGPGGRSAHVIRALSLVPEEVRAWVELSSAQYLSPQAMLSMESERALDRSQIELVAGRVSALNECFY